MVSFRLAGRSLSASAVALLLLAGAGEVRAADPEAEAMLAKLGRPGDFTLAPPDVSEEAAAGWYVRADVGYAAATGGSISYAGVPTGLDLSGAGWSVGGGLGYRVLPMLRAEASIDYLALGSAGQGIANIGASATAALASVYWDMITLAGFTPYLSAGAGFAIHTLDAPAALGATGNDWQFAWSAGAGVSYAFSASLSVDLGYRYVDLGSPAHGGALAASDQGVHQLRFGVRYALQ